MNNDSVYGAELTPFSVDEILQSTDFSCAIKCQQLILNMFGQNVTEQDLINEAFENGWATTNGTYLSDIGKLLDAHGVGVDGGLVEGWLVSGFDVVVGAGRHAAEGDGGGEAQPGRPHEVCRYLLHS